jgi:hypothetical protein
VLGIRRRGRQCDDELGAPHDTRGVEQCIDDSAHVLNLPFENIARSLTLRPIAMGLHHVDGAARAACSGWRSSCDTIARNSVFQAVGLPQRIRLLVQGAFGVPRGFEHA